METLKQLTPVARKEHKCMWCGGIIPKGEKYERGTYLFDGYVYDWINHISCAILVQKLNMLDYADEGITKDDFNEFIDEKYAEIMSNEHNELWESNDFIMPNFLGKVEFLKEYYNIK